MPRSVGVSCGVRMTGRDVVTVLRISKRNELVPSDAPHVSVDVTRVADMAVSPAHQAMSVWNALRLRFVSQFHPVIVTVVGAFLFLWAILHFQNRMDLPIVVTLQVMAQGML